MAEVTINYEYKDFKIGELLKAFNALAENFEINPEDVGYILYMKDDGIAVKKKLSLQELNMLCKFDENIHSVSFSASNTEYWVYITVTNYISIYVSMPSSEYVKKSFKILEEELNLILKKEEKPEDVEYRNLEQEIDDLTAEIIAIKDFMSLKRDKLKCFISYRFNKESKIILYELTRFLELLGVEVVTGAGYEPRKISEKVLDRLNDIDFIIYLITKEGESLWTRDELAISVGRGVEIVPIIEEGVDLERGILGDIDYIKFETGHIGDSFISIMEALNFIKNKREISLIDKAENESKEAEDST